MSLKKKKKKKKKTVSKAFFNELYNLSYLFQCKRKYIQSIHDRH